MIHWAEGLSPARVQGAAALVRQGRDAGVSEGIAGAAPFEENAGGNTESAEDGVHAEWPGAGCGMT